jgi:hypothetical protein
MELDNTQAVVLIERAERETPFCDCGEPMAPVARSDRLWLECISQPVEPAGGIRRLVAAIAAAGHTRRLILDPA